MRCPACEEAFEPPREDEGRSTVVCPRCRRVVVVPAPAGAARGASDPTTEAFLEPLRPAEGPTQVGVASQTLSLPPGKRVSVAILSGPRKGEVVVLGRPRLTIGRAGGGSDVELPDPDVSRSHAAVECHGARIVLRDLGSRNGTFLGDERISQREVADRAEFRVGGITFLLLVADE
jgi:hypothetical protein